MGSLSAYSEQNKQIYDVSEVVRDAFLTQMGCIKTFTNLTVSPISFSHLFELIRIRLKEKETATGERTV